MEAQEIGARAQREHQMIVERLMGVLSLAVRDDDFLYVKVDGFDIADEELSLSQELGDRDHDVRRIEIAGRDFMHHRSEEKKVIAVHQRDLHL